MSRTPQILFAAAALICLSAGCIQRTLRIQTDPPGANVWVNGDDCGRTPVDMPFVSYGAIEIFMQKKDYATRKEVVRLRAPWYAVFPIDFFTDVLYPGKLHDRKTFGFKLESLGQADMKALESRAEEFSENARKLLAKEREKRGIPAPAGLAPESSSRPAISDDKDSR